MSNDECFDYYLETGYSSFVVYDSDDNILCTMYIKDYYSAAYHDSQAFPLQHYFSDKWERL